MFHVKEIWLLIVITFKKKKLHLSFWCIQTKIFVMLPTNCDFFYSLSLPDKKYCIVSNFWGLELNKWGSLTLWVGFVRSIPLNKALIQTRIDCQWKNQRIIIHDQSTELVVICSREGWLIKWRHIRKSFQGGQEKVGFSRSSDIEPEINGNPFKITIILKHFETKLRKYFPG